MTAEERRPNGIQDRRVREPWTAEDSIVAKLEWFRLTDETSERQWDDLSRLVRIHSASLDIGYLETMAESIGVRDLLDRLLGRV